MKKTKYIIKTIAFAMCIALLMTTINLPSLSIEAEATSATQVEVKPGVTPQMCAAVAQEEEAELLGGEGDVSEGEVKPTGAGEFKPTEASGGEPTGAGAVVVKPTEARELFVTPSSVVFNTTPTPTSGANATGVVVRATPGAGGIVIDNPKPTIGIGTPGVAEITGGVKCPHFFMDGKCISCGECENHSYVNGVCTVCKKVCSHPSYNAGKCTACGEVGLLTFTSEVGGSRLSFSWVNGNDVQYSSDGENWSVYTAGTELTLEEGDKVSFRGHNVTTDHKNHFSITGRIAVSGDVTSLTNGNGGDATLSGSCYFYMFGGCGGLTSAPRLPATTLAYNCYASMFQGCKNLTSAPQLPATTLANGCYQNMFQGCTRLTSAPELPATTLANNCYASMFQGCTNLTSAPELPATTLANTCYQNMFKGCTSLTSAPKLLATTLADNCYVSMFQGCTSLTSAPKLLATTLADNCYQSMFENCKHLKVEKALSVQEASWVFLLSYSIEEPSLYILDMIKNTQAPKLMYPLIKCIRSLVQPMSMRMVYVRYAIKNVNILHM